MKYRNIEDLKPLETNPRTIDEDSLTQLIQSIANNGKYFEARPIILSDRTGELVILAGNQRYKAAKELKLKEVPTYLMQGLTEEQEKEIIMRDNISNGEFDYDIVAEHYGDMPIEDWGFDWMGNNVVVDGDEIEPPEVDKAPFTQKTFTLADEQAEAINEALSLVKKTEAFEQVESFDNKNTNGNAIYTIVLAWLNSNKQNQ